MKVYISGKIGEEVLSDATRDKFAKAESYLREWGFDVFNPTASGLGKIAEKLAEERDSDFYTEIMNLDLERLRHCDAIYMLRDWQDSPGAIREFMEANRLRLDVMFDIECSITR